MQFQTHCFPNGIRLVHQHTSLPLSHLGFIFNTGSRHEKQYEHGASHLVEHCLFKGTRKRKAYHVIARMENVGADINAYTSKDETVLHVSFLSEYLERSLDLLFDISFNSIFPEQEIKKEKLVILDEIRSAREQAFDIIHEEFESFLFNGHALGKAILGTEKSVKAFKRSNILDFYKRNFKPENLIICSSGDLPFNRLIRLVEKFSGEIDVKNFNLTDFKAEPLNPIPGYSVFNIRKKATYEQAHIVIGNRAYSVNDPKRYSLALLNNLLAGPTMSSLISYTLREKLGIAYHVEANYTPYDDCGQWLLYFATDPLMMIKATDHTFKVFKKIRSEKLGILQMSRASKQLIGQLFLLQDSNLLSILSAGRSLATYGRIDDSAEIINQVNSVTSSSVLDVANEILSPEYLSLLEYNPGGKS